MEHNKPILNGIHDVACTIDVCRLCHAQEDLRYGVCFTCADFVDGKQLENGTHHLWDSRNPTNEWFARE